MPTQRGDTYKATRENTYQATHGGTHDDWAAALLRRLAEGDQHAWGELVTTYRSMLLAVAAGLRVTGPEAEDAVQHTWLRLIERSTDIRDPRCLPGWLATTMRRECFSIRRAHWRCSPTGHEPATQPDRMAPEVAELVIARQEVAALRAALGRLPERQRDLVRALIGSAGCYAEAGEALGMPIGSIGPIRARALRRLRDLLDPAPDRTPAPAGPVPA